MQINTHYKCIHDNVHGFINISNIAQKIIDTPEFQRLRKLKQLGTCVYVFPNAVHSRFEHSLGTYHLAGKLLECITERTNPDAIKEYLRNIPTLAEYYKKTDNYVLDTYVKELIKISALCHDIGHGPFSHLFDDHFLNKLNIKNTHEERSGLLIERIINRELKFMSNEIDFIKSIINPTDETGFLYQIVSNNLNGLDIDKYDYIARDSYMLGQKSDFDSSRLVADIIIQDNNICYPEQTVFEISKMYQTRYNLHKQIYCHKAVIASQLLIIDLMFLLDPILKLSESVDDLDKFIKLNDEYILICVDILDEKMIDPQHSQNLIDAKCLVNRINNHNFYKLSKSFISDKPIDIDMESDDKIAVFKSKIGFLSGNKKNPLDNIYTYSKKDPSVKSKKALIEDISFLIPKIQQEYVLMLFNKEK